MGGLLYNSEDQDFLARDAQVIASARAIFRVLVSHLLLGM